MAGIIKPSTDQERTERQARVARALASVRLEGLEPTDAAKPVFDRYVAGDLTPKKKRRDSSAECPRVSDPYHGIGPAKCCGESQRPVRVRHQHAS